MQCLEVVCASIETVEAPRNYVKYTENVKNTHHFQSVLTALCTALPLLSISIANSLSV